MTDSYPTRNVPQDRTDADLLIRQGLNAEKATTELCPPNPKEFEMAESENIVSKIDFKSSEWSNYKQNAIIRSSVLLPTLTSCCCFLLATVSNSTEGSGFCNKGIVLSKEYVRAIFLLNEQKESEEVVLIIQYVQID